MSITFISQQLKALSHTDKLYLLQWLAISPYGVQRNMGNREINIETDEQTAMDYINEQCGEKTCRPKN